MHFDPRMYEQNPSGLYLPKEVAKEVGFACPKCDDYVLTPLLLMAPSREIAAFMSKHRPCVRELDSIELLKNGKVKITGKVPL